MLHAAIPMTSTRAARSYPEELDQGTPLAWMRRLLAEARPILDGVHPGVPPIKAEAFDGVHPSLIAILSGALQARLAGMHGMMAVQGGDRLTAARALDAAETRLSTMVSGLMPYPTPDRWGRHVPGSVATAPAYDLADVSPALASTFAQSVLAIARGVQRDAAESLVFLVEATADRLGLPAGLPAQRGAALLSRARVGEDRIAHLLGSVGHAAAMPLGTIAHAHASVEAALFHLVRDGSLGEGKPSTIGRALTPVTYVSHHLVGSAYRHDLH